MHTICDKNAIRCKSVIQSVNCQLVDQSMDQWINLSINQSSIKYHKKKHQRLSLSTTSQLKILMYAIGDNVVRYNKKCQFKAKKFQFNIKNLLYLPLNMLKSCASALFSGREFYSCVILTNNEWKKHTDNCVCSDILLSIL